MFQFVKDRYQQITRALSKTRSTINTRIRALLGKPWDESTFATLEQILYEADLGSACVEDLVQHLRSVLRLHPTNDLSVIMNQLKERALSLLNSTPTVSASLPMTGYPLVMLFIGINGSGKTTSIAKLGYHLKNQGHYPLLGAGDTFRAAAIEQLSYWAEQIDIPIVKTHPGGDVAAVAFDALNAAKSRKCDMVLLDTAGRLQNKIDLIQELNKVKKTCAKVIPSAPHEVFLVLDATMGQNALDQALVFHQHLSLTGLIITKLDGSAKGGVLLSIYHQLRVPIRWVGTGEGKDDLIPFDPKTYVNALFSN